MRVRELLNCSNRRGYRSRELHRFALLARSLTAAVVFRFVVTQRHLSRIIGRKLVERLRRAHWLGTVQTTSSTILFDERAGHKALRRVAKEGYLLSGRVRIASNDAAPKVRKRHAIEALDSIQRNELL